MKFRVFAGLLLLSISSVLSAREICHPEKTYCLDFPKGWVVQPDEPEFTVASATGQRLTGSVAPVPPKGQSMRITLLTVQATTLALGMCSKIEEDEVAISGAGWQGAGFVCRSPNSGRTPELQLLMVPVIHGSDAFLFTVFMPVETWSKERKQMLRLLRSLRFTQ